VHAKAAFDDCATVVIYEFCAQERTSANLREGHDRPPCPNFCHSMNGPCSLLVTLSSLQSRSQLPK
jgi:hypothetical protein